MSTIFLYAAISLEFLLHFFVEEINRRYARKQPIPEEFQDIVDQDKFLRSQAYQSEQTVFGNVRRVFSFLLLLLVLASGALGYLDQWVMHFGLQESLSATIFFLALWGISEVISLPFAYFHTFVLEEKYGFNRTTIKTFILDQCKGVLLAVLIGGPLLFCIFWLFEKGGEWAWLYAWAFLAFIQITLTFLAPVLIMPLFYRFDPLSEGELKSSVEEYARKENFQMAGVFTMDGSKRSSKANAFFTGFGPFRKIVLFDTLISQHTTKELLAVLAHEIGHYKLRHIHKQILLSFAVSFLLFWVCSRLILFPTFSYAAGFSQHTLHSGFFVAFILYAPISFFIGIFSSYISRKFEFEADAFAAKSTGLGSDLAVALKKLSVENLSNLSPHPWKVILDYSHPPVVQRLRKLVH